ncbi:MAG: hypothetical protein GXO54_04575 [Chloroflexi bacterium]|nr:hypothetical protein [Chloroflexota bacterium]
MGQLIRVAIVLAVGLVMLLAVLLPLPVLQPVQWAFASWAAVIYAAFFVLGGWDMLRQNLRARDNPLARGVFIVAFVVAFGVVMLQGPDGGATRWLRTYVLEPVAISLLGLIAVVLTYRATQVLVREPSPLAWSFVVGVFLFLSLDIARGFGLSVAQQAAWTLQRTVVSPALRGLMLGLSLGLITAGLRILLGADRPYQDLS